MSGKIKIGKLLAVIFLTVLIWVWADLAKTEQFTVPHARITVLKSAEPGLWVGFAGGGRSTSIEDVVVKGASSRIDKLRRRLKPAPRLDFDLDPAQEHMDEPGSHTFLMKPFLNKQMKQNGLKVESCKPEKITVLVSRLERKMLEVECFDENQNPTAASVDPAQVFVSIPEGTQGVARVLLNATELRQAKASPIKKRPFFQLPAGERRPAESMVEVTMPIDLLKPETIKPRVGLVLGVNIQGRYRIQVDNLLNVISRVSIKATGAAKRAYESMTYHALLEIYDDDIKATEPQIRRPLKYNFPAESLRKGEIQLNQQPVEAIFKLIPLPAAEEPSGG